MPFPSTKIARQARIVELLQTDVSAPRLNWRST